MNCDLLKILCRRALLAESCAHFPHFIRSHWNREEENVPHERKLQPKPKPAKQWKNRGENSNSQVQSHPWLIVVSSFPPPRAEEEFARI